MKVKLTRYKLILNPLAELSELRSKTFRDLAVVQYSYYLKYLLTYIHLLAKLSTPRSRLYIFRGELIFPSDEVYPRC